MSNRLFDEQRSGMDKNILEKSRQKITMDVNIYLPQEIYIIIYAKLGMIT